MNVDPRFSRGFTLIELMIVVAIIGILAAIAIPNYNEYLVRSRIPEAVSALADGRVKMEQHFQDNHTFVGGPCPANTKYFTLGCGVPTVTTFTVTATGSGPMTGFSYTIDQSNSKTSAIAAGAAWPAAALANCWITSQSGC